MALNINGTTGISGVDGSVSAPALTGTDSNTGITFPSADTIKFSTGGVERMSITNSGVTGTGIGAGKILQVVQGTSTTEDSFTTNSYVASSLSATITPTAASSKILIQSSFLVDTKANGRQLYLAVYRSINGGTFTNISGGVNTAAVATYAGSTRLIEKGGLIRLDTPSYSVGNSIVYKLYGRSESAAGLVTLTGQGIEDVIILQEIAA